MASLKIEWDEVIVRIFIGIFLAFQIGMGFYAMQHMTPEEKTNFILMLQQWE